MTITREGVEAARSLQLIACNATSTDHVDKEAAREKGVTVCRVPAQNTDSVSEHAFALYYAIRRRIVPLHQLAVEGDSWGETLGRVGKPPRTNAEETLVVVGHGAIGRNIERIGRALGMKVLNAERKCAEHTREGRTPFQEALMAGTIFMISAPHDNETRGMLASPELASMDSTAMIVNVGRGGIVDEEALADALRDGKIGGAATDVFSIEPATKADCPLLDPSIPNLVLSPHIAWYSQKTIVGTRATAKANIEGFVAGKPVNVVVSGIRGC